MKTELQHRKSREEELWNKNARYRSAVWECALPKPATWVTKLVLLRIAYSADKKGRCFLTLPALVRDTGLGRSTVFRHLKWLESAGLIQRQRVLCGRERSAVYTLVMAEIRARAEKRSGDVGEEAERGELEKILKRVRSARSQRSVISNQ